MRILILGGDGYLGWPTAMHFSRQGHEVAVVDNFCKRQLELELGSEPLVPIPNLHRRIAQWKSISGKTITAFIGDLVNHRFAYKIVRTFDPDAIVHYAEQPSAPYSMLGRKQAAFTQHNNVIGNLNVIFAIQAHNPSVHLVKLGTMGEYGTPNIDIEEGWLDIEHHGRQDRVLYPKKPGSFYHLSKVHDSHNLEFACRIWGCRVTDLNQGVVYGLDTPEIAMGESLHTSFHYDDVFGTVINRFCVQAMLGIPLTVYGMGQQTRGFLDIRDTLQCVDLAVSNPAAAGEFRVLNQFTEQFTIEDLAEKVVAAAKSLGVRAHVAHLENPRIEQEQHYYNAKNTALLDLGLKPHMLSEETLCHMMSKIQKAQDRVLTETIQPKVHWVDQRHSGDAG